MDYEFNAPVYHDFENPESNETKPLALGDTSNPAHHEDQSSKEPPVTVAPKEAPTCPEPVQETVEKPQPTEVPTQLSLNSTPTVDRCEDMPPLHLEEMETGTQDSELVESSLSSKALGHKTPTHKTPSRNSHSNQPVRQSPRLAAIAKSIRRSNAARGFLPSPGSSKNHRRSLSEGANIVTSFARVEKKRVQTKKISTVRPSTAEKGDGSKGAKDDLKTLESTTQYKKILAQNRQRSSNIHSERGPLKTNKHGPLKPTKPVEFNFATDNRVRGKVESNEPEVDFTRSLRSNTSSANTHQPKGTTKVQPFNLHAASKPKETGQPFISMAELSLKFHTKTPQRFRSKRYNSSDTVPEATKKARGITQPITPQLSSRLRARSVEHPTREQQEEKEIEEAQKHQFKARPLNKKILAEPHIKPVETSKVVTVPEPFDITDTKKASESKAAGMELLGSCKLLMASNVSLASIPHGGISTLWEKKATEVKPFSFDSRDMAMIHKKKDKIKKMIEEEKKLAEFHAQPMPIFETGIKGVPAKKPPTPTKVQPFNLISDIRGSAKQQALQKELEVLEEMEKKQRKFEAQPGTVVHQQPFVPEKSKKPLTDISGFSLNTDRRAEEREAYDAHLKEKEDELVARKIELEERKKREEEQAVQEMRKNAVHKAQPVRHYKPVEIKQGLLPPTFPVTPHFNIDQRLKSRAGSKPNINSTIASDYNQTMDSTSVLSTTNVDGTFTME